SVLLAIVAGRADLGHAARRHLGFDENEVAAQVADVIEQGLGAPVGYNVLEEIVPLCAWRPRRGRYLCRNALLDAIELARKHHKSADAAASLPAAAVSALLFLDAGDVAV